MQDLTIKIMIKNMNYTKEEAEQEFDDEAWPEVIDKS